MDSFLRVIENKNEIKCISTCKYYTQLEIE